MRSKQETISQILGMAKPATANQVVCYIEDQLTASLKNGKRVVFEGHAMAKADSSLTNIDHHDQPINRRWGLFCAAYLAGLIKLIPEFNKMAKKITVHESSNPDADQILAYSVMEAETDSEVIDLFLATASFVHREEFAHFGDGQNPYFFKEKDLCPFATHLLVAAERPPILWIEYGSSDLPVKGGYWNNIVAWIGNQTYQILGQQSDLQNGAITIVSHGVPIKNQEAGHRFPGQQIKPDRFIIGVLTDNNDPWQEQFQNRPFLNEGHAEVADIFEQIIEPKFSRNMLIAGRSPREMIGKHPKQAAFERFMERLGAIGYQRINNEPIFSNSTN